MTSIIYMYHNKYCRHDDNPSCNFGGLGFKGVSVSWDIKHDIIQCLERELLR